MNARHGGVAVDLFIEDFHSFGKAQVKNLGGQRRHISPDGGGAKAKKRELCYLMATPIRSHGDETSMRPAASGSLQEKTLHSAAVSALDRLEASMGSALCGPREIEILQERQLRVRISNVGKFFINLHA